MTDGEEVEAEKKGCTLCKKVSTFLGNAFAVSVYLGSRGAEGIAKGAKGAAKGAKNAYDWVDEHSDDMKRGYLIGADINNWFRYWSPLKVMKDIFRGEQTCPPTQEEFGYSVGVEKAKEYIERHDDAPLEEKAPITTATLLGGIAGTVTYLVAHPFISRHNKKKAKEMKESGLEETVEES